MAFPDQVFPGTAASSFDCFEQVQKFCGSYLIDWAVMERLREIVYVPPLLSQSRRSKVAVDEAFVVFIGNFCKTHSNNGPQKRLRHSAVVAE